MEDEQARGARKRKASPERAADRGDESPKRTRRHTSPGSHVSPARDRRHSSSRVDVDEVRTEPPTARASLEEKKRGKRLFGGLLSTLSQTSTNTHQKRRQDIEKQQLERRQLQKQEDTHKQRETSARMRETRIREQIAFKAEMMRQKHSKMLWLAQHLKTKAGPPIYYSPWKLTERQTHTIETQGKEAQDRIQAERLEFESSGRQDSQQHIPSQRTTTPKSDRD